MLFEEPAPVPREVPIEPVLQHRDAGLFVGKVQRIEVPQHIHAKRPVPHILLERAEQTLLPLLHVPHRQHDLGVGIRVHQFFREHGRGEVGDGFAVAEELVPVGVRKGTAFVLVFGLEGFEPEVEVWRVLGIRREAVVDVGVAELAESGAEGLGAGAGEA